jgi:glycosyltransferase involved in cell wall biosynthesis
MSAHGIAIPFYRNVDFLRDAIQSVVLQSSPDWRLRVFDDSGGLEPEADVRDLIASFADDRIRYHRNPRTLGMVANWNRCLEDADTELVTLLHGDDRLLPGYVGLMARLGAAHPHAVALFCRAAIIGASGRPAFSLADQVKRFFAPRAPGGLVLRGERAATALMRGNFIMCPTLAFRRSVLGARRFDPAWEQVQDLELSVRLLMEGETLVGSSELAYAYRRHEESATSLQSRNRLRFDEEFRLFDQVAARAEALGWTETARVARRKRIVKLHLGYRVLRDVARLEPGSALATLRYLLRHLRSRW